MPIREFLCRDCGHIQEVIVHHPEDLPEECDHCDSVKIEKLPALIGGYRGNMGSASTSPKSTFRKPKK